MRIVHFCTSLSRSAGGLFNALTGLAKAQQAAGAEVTVVGGTDRFFPEDQYGWGEVPLKTFPLPIDSIYGLAPSAFRLLPARRSVDIVHVHGLWSISSIYGRLAALGGHTIVLSPHGMLDPWILARKPRIKAVHAALFEHPLLASAHVHALADAERQAIESFSPRTAGRTFVVPNGVEPVPKPSSTERRGALYLGRIHDKKQTLQLAQVWAATEAFRHETLTIAGWGSPSDEAALRACTANMFNVEFVGPIVRRGERPSLSPRRAGFVFPSLGQGLPNAVLKPISMDASP